jgi:hypothetical protein
VPETPPKRMVRLDDAEAVGIRQFRARLGGTIGEIPSVSLTVKILLRIGNEYFDQAESIIRQESE